jgi:hypothetical protein
MIDLGLLIVQVVPLTLPERHGKSMTILRSPLIRLIAQATGIKAPFPNVPEFPHTYATQNYHVLFNDTRYRRSHCECERPRVTRIPLASWSKNDIWYAILFLPNLFLTDNHTHVSAEVQPCDGYNSTGARTAFPLQGGLISVTSEHKTWTRQY